MNDAELKEWLKLLENVAPLLPANIELHKLLFVGGQGVVYRGLVDDINAAIKIYFPGQTNERIEREIRALRELRCDTIVDLLWADKVYFNERDLNVVATSFVEGMTINELINPDAPLEVSRLGILAYDVALAIQAMWARRIVHRDLKPSNVLLRLNGRACVIDLGLARHLDDSSLTQMGATWGTLGYLSPEQMKLVRNLTCKSDIFALGIILIEAAMGRHPTFGDQMRLQARSLHEELPREIRDWQYADLLKKMLQPSAPKRPKPEEILQILERYAK